MTRTRFGTPAGFSRLQVFSNQLGADVPMPLANTEYQGPSMANVGPGVYLLLGTCCVDAAGNSEARITDAANNTYAACAATYQPSGIPLVSPPWTFLGPTTIWIAARSVAAGGTMKAATPDGAHPGATILTVIRISDVPA